jgi:hypothetical protein
MFAAGLVVAEENGASDWRISRGAEVAFRLDYGNDQLSEHDIDERTIDRLGLFDSPDSGQSTPYSLELALENEDSDWSFEVTVTMEF